MTAALRRAMTHCPVARFSRRACRLPQRGYVRKPMPPATATSRDHPDALFAKPAISAERRADGSIILKSTTPLKESARCIGDWLEHWAQHAPQRIFLADRAGADAPWRTVSYADALRQVRSAAA